MNNNDIDKYLFALKRDLWLAIYDKTFPIPKATLDLSKNEGYFHYTSLTSALNILKLSTDNESDKVQRREGKFVSLWASHFLFLNDAQELLDGLKKVCDNMENKINQIKSPNHSDAQEWLKQYKDLFLSLMPNNLYAAPNNFILCFCSDGNLLSQWEHYGKESGIAIEFDLDNCLFEGFFPLRPMPNPTLGKPTMFADPIKVTPRKVIYNQNNKEKAIKKILTKSAVKNSNSVHIMAMQALAAASFMKHPCFENEHEVRLMFSPNYFSENTYDEIAKLIHYREINGIVKPYMEIHIKHEYSGKNIIKSITVGPGHNQNLVLNAILKLVQTRFAEKIEPIEEPIKWEEEPDHNYKFAKVGNIEVRYSTIPFRGF